MTGIKDFYLFGTRKKKPRPCCLDRVTLSSDKGSKMCWSCVCFYLNTWLSTQGRSPAFTSLRPHVLCPQKNSTAEVADESCVHPGSGGDGCQQTEALEVQAAKSILCFLDQ